jgi:hypothetical protein
MAAIEAVEEEVPNSEMTEALADETQPVEGK